MSGGIYEVLIPFALIFTICYGILNKVNILGKSKNVHVGASLAISLTVVMVHVMGKLPPNRDAVVIINKFIPNMTILFVVIVMFLLMIGMFGGEIRKNQPGLFSVVIIFAILLNMFFKDVFPNLAPFVLWMTLIITGLLLLRNREGKAEEFIPGWIMVIAFIAVALILLSSMDIKAWPTYLSWLTGDAAEVIGVSLIVMFAAIYYITRASKES